MPPATPRQRSRRTNAGTTLVSRRYALLTLMTCAGTPAPCSTAWLAWIRTSVSVSLGIETIAVGGQVLYCRQAGRQQRQVGRGSGSGNLPFQQRLEPPIPEPGKSCRSSQQFAGTGNQDNTGLQWSNAAYLHRFERASSTQQQTTARKHQGCLLAPCMYESTSLTS